MSSFVYRWTRRYSCFLLVAGLTALIMGGCQPTTPPDDNGNDNEPPAGREVNVLIAPAGGGTVDQEADGDMVTLTAVANESFLFDGWSGADLDDPDANPITVDATEVSTITANFIEGQGPPSPGDADGDGVLDGVDECPDTPAGTPVDAVGCPAPDEDDDGVANSRDQCPGTVPGAQVDGDGCANAQLDSDNDGVNDAIDECERTPTTVPVDAAGCPLSEPTAPDDDDDGVGDDVDQCLGTPAGEDVDANGCAASQRDADQDGVSDAVDQCPDTAPRAIVDATGCTATTPPPPPPPPPPPQTCGNGTIEGSEQCDTGGESATCNSNCTTARCGDGVRNVTAGECCDDGNTTAGDGCGADCQHESNDLCSLPTAITSDGTLAYNNEGACTDGPDEPGMCTFFETSQIESDIWFCYTASCTGTAFVSLCGSEYDTKLAVYDGCGCPTSAPLACSDDACGTPDSILQSRVEIAVTAGQQYMIRAGGFIGEQGEGLLTIGCNRVDACTAGTGDCFAASPTEAPGCADPACCADTCEFDQYCCDVEWDETCAGEAQGICTGNFPACAPESGACGIADTTPGCEDPECCNTVCRNDPYCCVFEWDAACANEARSACFLTCTPTAEGCATQHLSPGCNVESCCRTVCEQDPFCCDAGWDDVCVDIAAELCP